MRAARPARCDQTRINSGRQDQPWSSADPLRKERGLDGRLVIFSMGGFARATQSGMVGGAGEVMTIFVRRTERSFWALSRRVCRCCGAALLPAIAMTSLSGAEFTRGPSA